MPIGMKEGLVAEREFSPQPTLKSYKSQEKQEVKIAKIQRLYIFLESVCCKTRIKNVCFEF